MKPKATFSISVNIRPSRFLFKYAESLKIDFAEIAAFFKEKS